MKEKINSDLTLSPSGSLWVNWPDRQFSWCFPDRQTIHLVIEGGDADHDRLPSNRSLIQISVTPFSPWPTICQNLEQSRDVPWIYLIMIAENQWPACFRSFRRFAKNQWYLASAEAIKVFLSSISFLTHFNPD
jgi:hypothetical protein